MQITGELKKINFTVLHAFLERYAGYTTIVSVGLCVALWLARVAYSHEWTFHFLNWNLFLAGVPYLSSIVAAEIHRKQPQRVWLVILFGVVTIAFFPNAPYIVTDFLHLTWTYPPVPQWYDVGMVAAFAWTGVVLGVYALRFLQQIVEDWVGPVFGWVFVLIVIALSGTGIYMGRFLRWNSWDLVVQPREVILDIAHRLGNPLAHPRTYGVSLMFAAFLFICYLALTLGPKEHNTLD